MITKLSPPRLVSTVMGMWFLATAFSESLAAIIAQFTGVTGGSGRRRARSHSPETVHVYGDVFGKIAICAVVAVVDLLRPGPALDPLDARGGNVDSLRLEIGGKRLGVQVLARGKAA